MCHSAHGTIRGKHCFSPGIPVELTPPNQPHPSLLSGLHVQPLVPQIRCHTRDLVWKQHHILPEVLFVLGAGLLRSEPVCYCVQLDLSFPKTEHTQTGGQQITLLLTHNGGGLLV